MVGQRSNGKAMRHRRKAPSHEGSMGLKRSQHRERVEDLASSIDSLSSIEESKEDSEIEEEH